MKKTFSCLLQMISHFLSYKELNAAFQGELIPAIDDSFQRKEVNFASHMHPSSIICCLLTTRTCSSVVPHHLHIDINSGISLSYRTISGLQALQALGFHPEHLPIAQQPQHSSLSLSDIHTAIHHFGGSNVFNSAALILEAPLLIHHGPVEPLHELAAIPRMLFHLTAAGAEAPSEAPLSMTHFQRQPSTEVPPLCSSHILHQWGSDPSPCDIPPPVPPMELALSDMLPDSGDCIWPAWCSSAIERPGSADSPQVHFFMEVPIGVPISAALQQPHPTPTQLLQDLGCSTALLNSFGAHTQPVTSVLSTAGRTFTDFVTLDLYLEQQLEPLSLPPETGPAAGWLLIRGLGEGSGGGVGDDTSQAESGLDRWRQLVSDQGLLPISLANLELHLDWSLTSPSAALPCKTKQVGNKASTVLKYMHTFITVTSQCCPLWSDVIYRSEGVTTLRKYEIDTAVSFRLCPIWSQ